ncbi:MAG: hypothetical protein H6555_01250 [Lewinellaceae bacterium]|nr:hypothetical protein [Lewinellaceae bacterium]
MKRTKILLYTLVAALLLPFSSCKDEALNPVPAPETAVHGFARVASGSATSFLFRNMTTPINLELQWISIDQLNTVTKMEVFVNFRESYVDAEGNPRTANHGTKKIVTIEGSAVPANRTYTGFTISPTAVYEAFKDAKFDYGDGKGSVSVFSNTFKPDRRASARFTPDDSFSMTWAFTTADGRYFDSWSDSVCSEFPGANCTIRWAVVCESAIQGTYTATFTGSSTDSCCPGALSGGATVTLTRTGDGKYTISDWSAGYYLKYYGVYGIDATTNMSTTLLDVCGKIVINQFVEPFGESCSGSGTINDDGSITYSWENGYGDKGTVTLVKQ